MKQKQQTGAAKPRVVTKGGYVRELDANRNPFSSVWSMKVEDFEQLCKAASEQQLPFSLCLKGDPGWGKTTILDALNAHSRLIGIDGDPVFAWSVVRLAVAGGDSIKIHGKDFPLPTVREGEWANTVGGIVSRYGFWQWVPSIKAAMTRQEYYTWAGTMIRSLVHGNLITTGIGSAAIGGDEGVAAIVVPDYQDYTYVLWRRDHDPSIKRGHNPHPILQRGAFISKVNELMNDVSRHQSVLLLPHDYSPHSVRAAVAAIVALYKYK